MAEKKEAWKDLREAIDKVWFKPVEIRVLAVLAELEEQEKPKRGATQEEIGRRYGISGRMLRYWVGWYKTHGVEGLNDLGGRGAKPRHPPEKVKEIIDECLREAQDAADGGGVPCKACDAAEKGRRPGPTPPEPCPCRGRCATRRSRGRRGGCACGPGKACACRCCRPIRLRPKGPRHAPGCPNARISPKNGAPVARVAASMKEKLGDSCSDGHMRRIMKGNALTCRRITRQHASHAPRGKVVRRQRRLRPSLKKYEEDGWTIFVHDEAHVVHDKRNGSAWGPKGERTTLPRSGSGGRATVHGSISTKGVVVMGEYVRADSFTFADHMEALLKDHDKVLIITDNLSVHTSKDTKNALRRLRRKYPGKKIRIRTLPVGSPYLSVVEELWNILKSLLLARYHYRTFDDMRWELADFAERTKTVELDAVEYLFRDPALYAIA